MAPPTVGLTGGIASGKSTVARLFRALGIPVVDADAIAREVVAPGTVGLATIVQTFGADVLDDAGALDRKKLGAIVFADESSRTKLNAIVHPLIAARSAELLAESDDLDVPYRIYEAALLVENGLHRMFAALIVVATHEQLQVARLMVRDALNEAAARARVSAQLSLEHKLEAADIIIDNEGTIESLEHGVAEAHAALLERFRRKS